MKRAWIGCFVCLGCVAEMSPPAALPEMVATAPPPRTYPVCTEVPPPEPSASAAPSASASGLPPSDVPHLNADEVIARNRWRFKACYNRALVKDRTAAGTVKVSVRVDLDGTPTPKVLCTTAPSELAECVANAFRPMRFPAPEGGSATFTVPVVFSVKK